MGPLSCLVSHGSRNLVFVVIISRMDMATDAIFSFLRRRNSLSLEAFLEPVDLSGVPLVQTLASLSAEIISRFSGERFSFQRKNSRSLIRKIEFLAIFFKYLTDSGWDSNSGSVSSTAVLCFKELYLLLHHFNLLLQYCVHSSKLWLLLQNPSLSGLFHDLNRDFLTLLDVLPVYNLNLSNDIREQIELLHKQSSQSRLFLDYNDETLRDILYSFLDRFENGNIPSSKELRYFFVQKLQIKDPKSCRDEIEFLEEQMVYYGVDSEPSTSVVNGFVDITRYAMYSLFRFESEPEWRIENTNKQSKCFIAKEIEDTFKTIPNDFICSISLNLMNDPVVISTGQTYDRISIERWFETGRYTCPTTWQKLQDLSLVPNLALTCLITRWSAAMGNSYESVFIELQDKSLASLLQPQSRASIEANKATVSILIQNLADVSGSAQTVAVREMRLLAKTFMRKRTILIGEEGAITHLHRLLKSENAVVQENAITAMFNLSRPKDNKNRMMDENDCLESIVSVLVSGLTVEARENAAVTLYCLSTLQGSGERIANVDGCIESLALLVQHGTTRGKLDAIAALQQISIHPGSCTRMVNSGGVSALVGALVDEDVAGKAAGALAVVANQSLAAEAIGREESALAGLIRLMRCGTMKSQENAVAALLQVCKGGGAVVVEKVVRVRDIEGLTEWIVFSGTSRACRKAIALFQILKDYKTAMMRSGNREESFATDVSVPITISVPVL